MQTHFARVSVVDLNEANDTLLCDVQNAPNAPVQREEIRALAFWSAFVTCNSRKGAHDARTVALGSLFDLHFDECPSDLVGKVCTVAYRAPLLAH